MVHSAMTWPPAPQYRTTASPSYVIVIHVGKGKTSPLAWASKYGSGEPKREDCIALLLYYMTAVDDPPRWRVE